MPTKAIDFTKYETIEDLQDVIEQAQEEIERRRETARAEMIEHIKVMAQQYGLTVEEFLNPKRKRRTSKRNGIARKDLAIKYRHSEDETLTWTGAGRQPKWLRDAIAEGARLEDFEV